MRRQHRAFLLAASICLASVGLGSPPSAEALSAGVAFSAEALPTWQADGIVWTAGQANGKVYVGGSFSQLRPPSGVSGNAVDRANFAVLDAETGAPDACRLDVSLINGVAKVSAIVASPDGSTVYLGGNFSNVGGTTVNRLASIDTGTCSVRPFQVGPVSSTVSALALSGSTLYVGGAFNTIDGSNRNQFAAVSTTTGELLPFVADAGLSGRAATDAAEGRAIAVSPDGTKIALGGEFDTINGADSHALAIVDAITGADVQTYPNNFIPRDSVTKALVTSGNSLLAGNEGTGPGVFDGRLAIDWTSMSQVWRDTCLGATQALVAYAGTLYSGSHAHNCSSMGGFADGQRNYFNAQSISAPALLGWHPQANDGIGEGLGPRALTVAKGASTGKAYLWATGEFTKINGSPQQGLTRFGPDDTDPPAVPNPVADAMPNGTVQVRIRAAVDADDSNLTYRVYRNGASTPSWTIAASSLWWTRPQITVVDSAVTAGTTYTYRVSVSDGANTSAQSTAVSAKAVASSASYVRTVLADKPSLYWRLEESSGSSWVQDRSGATSTGLNGLSNNAPTTGTAGIAGGKAFTLDGVDDQVTTDQFVPGPTTYSIETWIKTSSTTGGKIIGYGNGRPRTDDGIVVLSNRYDRHLYMEKGGRLDFGVSAGGYRVARSAKSYNDGAWHHVVATQSSTGLTLYVDGTSVATAASSAPSTYNGVWHLGGDNLSGWPNQPGTSFFRGSIDETAVYPSVLTATKVASHYSSGVS